MSRRLGEVAALVVLAGTGLVAAGVGQGSPPRRLPISASAERREIRAVAHGGALARRGERLFKAHGCSDCHTLAAGGYDGRLGPRLDVLLQGSTVPEIEAFILHPPQSIPGYEAGLMPQDFGSRLPRRDVRALATFIRTAADGVAGSSSH